jgi:hypothetical protein
MVLYENEMDRVNSASSQLIQSQNASNSIIKNEYYKRPLNKFVQQSKYLLEYNEPVNFDLHYIFLGATSRHYEELFRVIDHFDDL